ncbi:MAG: hypothetical protein OEZ01_00350 [Candidatus Heimdallarchaeota archaeon]|nr:hypothetical protein [Candidatus Heimdallarchaeota archaeon]
MNSPTIELIRMIDNPLIDNSQGSDVREDDRLYKYAFRNNIEMLYFAALIKHNQLRDLKGEYEELLDRQKMTLRTVSRLAGVLDEGLIPHAITKTVRPYPGTPNDIDCLYLGALDMYEQAGRYLQEQRYRLTGPQDMQYEFFDELLGDEFNNYKGGGRFYIDFYRELAADHMPYMDSDILLNCRRKIEILSGEPPITVFTPEAEMVVLALHSVLMHRTMPLEVFYTYSYYLADMTEGQIKGLWGFAKKNHAEPAFKAIITLMETLYKEAFQKVPHKLSYLIECTGRRVQEKNQLEKTVFSTPHVILLSTFVLSVFSKIRGKRSRRGFIKELIHMLNPVFAVEVLYHMLSKKFIDKHSDHV